MNKALSRRLRALSIALFVPGVVSAVIACVFTSVPNGTVKIRRSQEQDENTQKRAAQRGVWPPPTPWQVNYFIGNDPTQWRTGISTYAKVAYQNVYPGVDLVYYGNQQQLEYDFIVRPGTDPDIIALSFEGADQLEVAAQGELVLHASDGEIRQRKPLIYQEVNGVRHEVAGNYKLKDKNTVGFQLASYDLSRPLVIDPVLVYSTFLGGSNFDAGQDIAVDASGSAYVTGASNSVEFPTTVRDEA